MAVKLSIDESLRATCGKVEFLQELVVDLYVAGSFFHDVAIENFSDAVGESDTEVLPFLYPR